MCTYIELRKTVDTNLKEKSMKELQGQVKEEELQPTFSLATAESGEKDTKPTREKCMLASCMLYLWYIYSAFAIYSTFAIDDEIVQQLLKESDKDDLILYLKTNRESQTWSNWKKKEAISKSELKQTTLMKENKAREER